MQKRYALAVLLLIALISVIGCSKGKSKDAINGDAKTADHITAIADKKSNTDFSGEDIIFSKADYFYTEDTMVEILSKKPGNKVNY